MTTYSIAATAAARRIEISPVTSGRPGLFSRSISRSAIWLTMFDAAFIADAQSEPIATVRNVVTMPKGRGTQSSSFAFESAR